RRQIGGESRSQNTVDSPGAARRPADGRHDGSVVPLQAYGGGSLERRAGGREEGTLEGGFEGPQEGGVGAGDGRFRKGSRAEEGHAGARDRVPAAQGGGTARRRRAAVRAGEMNGENLLPLAVRLW